MTAPDILTDCTHFVLDDSVKENLHRITEFALKVKPRCAVCHTQKSVWCCIACSYVGCGRYEKQHAAKHAQKENHYICVNMSSPTHLWCYKCDESIMYIPSNNSNSNNKTNIDNSTKTNNSQIRRRSPNNNKNKNNRQQNGRIDIRSRQKKWKNGTEILTSNLIWHSSINGGICGLQNLGNTCFMNASLQALLHCPPVIYLFTLPELTVLNRYHRVKLCQEFFRFATLMWQGKHRILVPRNLLTCVMHLFPQFRGFGQHDAHEFLTAILSHIHEQYRYSIPIYETNTNTNTNANHKSKHQQNHTDDADTPASSNSKSNPNHHNHNNNPSSNPSPDPTSSPTQPQRNKKPSSYKETSLIHDLFAAEQISEVQCLTCQERSVTKEIITYIQVQIPKQDQMDKAVQERKAEPVPTKGWFGTIASYVGLSATSIPLDLCLHSYCTSEDLMLTEKYACPKCKKKQVAKKALSLSKLPEILMIHIKRFSYSMFGSHKVSTHVSFPINQFNVGQYLHPQHMDDQRNRDTVYDLCSIVRHMGGTGGGHYISFCRHPASDKWYKFDDTRVELITPEKLQEQQAYILFYTRRKGNQHVISHHMNHMNHMNHMHSNMNVNMNMNGHGDSNDANALQHNNRSVNALNTIATVMNIMRESCDAKLLENVQLSRYWLHKIVAFGRPSPIDNLWLNCYHGFPLRAKHDRRQSCSVNISASVWNEFIRLYGKQYNTQILHTSDTEDAEDGVDVGDGHGDGNTPSKKSKPEILTENDDVGQQTDAITETASVSSSSPSKTDANDEPRSDSSPDIAIADTNANTSTSTSTTTDTNSVDMEVDSDTNTNATTTDTETPTNTKTNAGDTTIIEKKSTKQSPTPKPKPKPTSKAKDEHLMKKSQIINCKYRLPWESENKSDVCLDCYKEEVHGRREYEKAEVRRLEDDGLPQDCALDMKFANAWRNFVHGKTDIIPDRIDNRYLHAGNHMVKEEFAKDTHYLMVPSNIWHFLVEHYGGGPKLVPTDKAYIPPQSQSQSQSPSPPKTKSPSKSNKNSNRNRNNRSKNRQQNTNKKNNKKRSKTSSSSAQKSHKSQSQSHNSNNTNREHAQQRSDTHNI